MITQVVKMHQRTLKEHCGSYPHELIRQFLKTHFFLSGFCVYGAFTTAPESGFQNNAVSVSGFTTGFV